MQKRRLLSTVVILLSLFQGGLLYGQDAVFSQFYASALYLNPAYASAEPNLTVGLNSRRQWSSIIKTTPYSTNQISLIVPLYKAGASRNFGGAGLSIYNDMAGDGNLMTTGANLNLGYNLNVSEHHAFSFGLQIGLVQKSINFDQLTWGSQYDPYNGFNSSVTPSLNNTVGNRLYADIGGGFMYTLNPGRNVRETGASVYAGASAYHLNKPNESLITSENSPLPPIYKIHGGMEYTFSDHFNVSPNLLYAMQNGKNQINAGAYLSYMFGNDESKWAPNSLTGGGWYRLDDSFIALIGIGSSMYNIGFSFDYNSSSLRTNTRGKGAYEISLSLVFPHKQTEAQPVRRRIQTPRF